MTLAFDEYGSRSSPTVLVLHGILGSRRNWRNFVKNFAAEHPAWHFLVVDLRHHGDSMVPAGPSDGLNECAQDLVALFQALDVWPERVWGHSFGGKVALKYAEITPRAPQQVWVLDALPGRIVEVPQDSLEGSVRAIIETLMTVPLPVPSRNGLRDALLDMGFSNVFASWMTTNLERQEAGGFVWRFNLPAMPGLLRSYAEADFWNLLEERAQDIDFHFVQAANSERWRPEVLAEFQKREVNSGIRRHILPDSGHWVHVDNPTGLAELLRQGLSK